MLMQVQLAALGPGALAGIDIFLAGIEAGGGRER